MKTDLTVAGYILNNNKTLLIYHKKIGLWLPVGGHIEENETPVEPGRSPGIRIAANEQHGAFRKNARLPSPDGLGQESRYLTSNLDW